jgi:hypothetical protein
MGRPFCSGRTGPAQPHDWQGSVAVAAIAGHRLHLDSGGSEELTDLAGVLENVQWPAADNDSVWHPVVSMSAGEWPSRRVLGDRIQRTAHPPAAVIDVTEEFGLRLIAMSLSP